MKQYRVLHYPGSKWRLANWIIDHMPDHKTYLEPFFGSGAILFNKPRTKVETVNDIDGEVVNLFKVIREKSEEFTYLINYTPYAREEYDNSYDEANHDVERARRFLTRCWQSIGGKTSDKTGWRSIIDPNGPYPPKDFDNLPRRVIEVAERLKNVQIENQDFEQLLERYRRPEVLIYADPPYLSQTRTNRHYKYEMSEYEHEILLDYLNDHPGPVLLSGYEHHIYNHYLSEWKKETMSSNSEAGAKKKEVLWINPVAAEHIYGLRLC
ncbi:DNA adenine methylase [Bacillus sp. A301a_S52]|nr:DNA adenine methylase [Bacillus sp. A301a_S52]